MQWRRATDTGPAARPSGWYWMYGPRRLGRHDHDPSDGVLFLVHVDAEGRVSSPLGREPGPVAYDARTGAHWQVWTCGPVAPGDVTGRLRARVVDDTVVADVVGESPTAPGWWWCRTNPEAPLRLVDEGQVGPVYLAADATGAVRVYVASAPDGAGLELGELGFSEPLVSRGGVIDDSGELGRIEAEFLGPITLPPPPPPPEEAR